jgi:hypothetical protein
MQSEQFEKVLAGCATGLEHIHMPNDAGLDFNTVWEFGDQHCN